MGKREQTFLRDGRRALERKLNLSKDAVGALRKDWCFCVLIRVQRPTSVQSSWFIFFFHLNGFVRRCKGRATCLGMLSEWPQVKKFEFNLFFKLIFFPLKCMKRKQIIIF